MSSGEWIHEPSEDCDARWIMHHSPYEARSILRFSRTADKTFRGEQWVAIIKTTAVYLGPEPDRHTAQRLALIIRGMLP